MWVREMAVLCKPAAIHWCDGSPAEYDDLCERLVGFSAFIRLNPERGPNSYPARSDPAEWPDGGPHLRVRRPHGGRGANQQLAAPHFSHRLRLGRILPSPPPIFGVNWFRTDKKGYFLWPGYGENRRISKCIIDRANGCAAAIESPLAWKPRHEDLDWRGLEGFPPGRFQELLAVDRDARANGFISHEDLLIRRYDRLPNKLIFIRELILSGLWRSPERWEPGVWERPFEWGAWRFGGWLPLSDPYRTGGSGARTLSASESDERFWA